MTASMYCPPNAACSNLLCTLMNAAPHLQRGVAQTISQRPGTAHRVIWRQLCDDHVEHAGLPASMKPDPTSIIHHLHACQEMLSACMAGHMSVTKVFKSWQDPSAMCCVWVHQGLTTSADGLTGGVHGDHICKHVGHAQHAGSGKDARLHTEGNFRSIISGPYSCMCNTWC